MNIYEMRLARGQASVKRFKDDFEIMRLNALRCAALLSLSLNLLMWYFKRMLIPGRQAV